MEAAAAGAGRGGPLTPPPVRKEWRAATENSFRGNGVEEVGHGNLGSSSDERTIYEEGAGRVEYRAITIDPDGGDTLQQRLQSISRKREELQQLEFELRAQVIAAPQILEVRSSFEVRLKEQNAATTKLKEQLHDREKYILDLEIKLDEKERELRALKIDNEAAWAKDDLLREQNMELANFRRERDNAEAERAQHLKQIHDFQEHMQEKDGQLLALEEQHRIIQEQLRDAHSWIARIQEMDALQSTTLQAELRERTEQFNQYWIGFQRQYVEMERHHMQVIQNLQLELASMRESNGSSKDVPRSGHENVADSSHLISNGHHSALNAPGTQDNCQGQVLNGSIDGPAKVDHATSLTVAPLLGVGGFLPPGQMAGVHPYMMHPQGVPQPIASTSASAQLGQFEPMTTIPTNQQWESPKELENDPLPHNHGNLGVSQEVNSIRFSTGYDHELAAQKEAVRQDNLESGDNLQLGSAFPSMRIEPIQELKILDPKDAPLLVSSKQQQLASKESEVSMASNGSSKSFGQQEQKSEMKAELKEKLISATENHSDGGLTSEQGDQSDEPVPLQKQVVSNLTSSAAQTQSHGRSENGSPDVKSRVVSSADMVQATGNASASLLPRVMPKEPSLLDEKSLLACIVRAVPTGSDGRIRISTTLPNRLGKMLAPLHWHDYKKIYGKLDDFLAKHPELFVIDGDLVHLRDGAQQVIAATTAAAKLAASAASLSSPPSSVFQSVVVTPVAQSVRPRRPAAVVDSRPTNVYMTNGSVPNSLDKHTQNLPINDQQHISSFDISNGVADRVISKPKNSQEPIHPSIVGGGKYERAGQSSHDGGVSNGRINHGSRQSGRSSVPASFSRRS